MSATALSFTERLCLAHDINRGAPPADGAERATREEIIEYIDAHDIAHSPDHPTSAIAWDLQRTLGERDGRRMLLYASRRWDAEPLRPRDVVELWWWEDYEPEAWVDEYLLDVIRGWRSERDRLRLCAAAKNEWLAFDGVATQQQVDLWREKFGAWYLDPKGKHGPVTIVATLQQAQFAREKKSGTLMPSNVVSLHPAAQAAPAAVKHEDFWAYSPAHSYIFVPTGEHWPASTVNSRLAPVTVPMREKPVSAAMYLDQNRSVEQATWAPGQPQIIEDRLIADGGWIDRAGCKTFNLYRPPTIKPKAGDVAPWIDHVRWIYPEEADNISSGSRNGCNIRSRKSIIVSSWAAIRALARIRCSNRSRRQLARGTVARYRRSKCLGALIVSLSP